ncbi:hypothetical protein Dsin_018585 [Dipteronia sinensis]|uniref:Survival motor neuron interacting protein n=1 Tax=Dipteronia sinensis TaxID=43782 RepID=A0AAE0E387_9ROSI|nr:hypothetical protein Dsin_018585 [Dipteronia sinensis]
MADNMETDTCSGFKRRMKDIQSNHFHQEQQEPSGSFSTSTAQDSQESSDITFSTSKDDDSKNIEIRPGFCKKVKCSYDDKKKQLGFGIEEHLGSEEVRDFLVSEGNSVDSCVEVDETENREVGCVADVGETMNGVEKSLLSSLVGKEDKDFVKVEEGFSGSQEFEKFNQEKELEVVVEMGSITKVDSKENLPTYSIFAVGESNGVMMGKEIKSQTLLDTDNNRMLTELGHGTILVDKTHVGDVVAGRATISQIDEKRSGCEEVHKIMQKDGEKIAGLHVIDGSVRSSLKIEVIDDTALIESVQVPETGNGCMKDIGIEGTAKKIGWKGKKEEKKQESDENEKKVKHSRRKAKDTKRNERMKNMTPIMEDQDGCLKNGEQSLKMYSRQEMEALRFVNIVEQRKLWNTIYTGLGLEVSNEYDQLANSKQKNTLLNFDPRKRFSRKLESPGILREGGSRKVDNELEYIEGFEVENVNTGNSTCSHSTKVEDTVLEEKCNEDYDTDEDYASIQRPVFLVEGEPDFDSGPPEDGLEYLRRVRWEAAHIPKVKVAKLGGNKFNKKQSVYMPQIPNIAPCPEHLLPLKEWEDSFLADFSELRQVMSVIENSSAQAAHKLQPLLIFHKDSDSSQLAEGFIVEKFNKLKTDEVNSHQPVDIECSIDQPSMSSTEYSKISLCRQSPETSLNDDSGNYPTMSAILRLDSVARVSMLRKRISSFETLSTLSRNDSVWLFALCATVDTPLDADTCAALRSLLRKCASLRAGKSELDDEVVMLNILATVSGRYFGQSED